MAIQHHNVLLVYTDKIHGTRPSPEAKRWKFQRLVYWDAGTAHIDTDQSDDSQRTLGTVLAWQAPTIGIDPDQRLTVTISPPATEGSFGTWIVRANNLQRSVF